jgi:hypothetical protein
MNLKQLVEDFQQLSPALQVALLAFALMIVVLLVFFPAAGTSIITFLIGLKMLVSKR